MFNFLFNPCGRISRKQMWGFFFATVIAGFAAGFVDGLVFGPRVAPEMLFAGELPEFRYDLTFFLNMFLLWPSIAVPVKRFHDRGMTGWWVLIFAVGIGFSVAFAVFELLASANAGATGSAGVALFAAGALVIAEFVILYCLPGQDGSNKHGPDPRDPSASSLADVFGEAKPDAPEWAASVDFNAALANAAPQPAAAASASAARYGQRRAAPAPTGPVAFGRRAR